MAVQPSGRAQASVFVVSAPRRRAWATMLEWWTNRRFVRSIPGARFAVCGITSAGGGTRDLGASPSLRRQLVLVEWDSVEDADAGSSRLLSHWRSRGSEVWTASMKAMRSTGSWEGAEPFAAEVDAVPEAPVVAVLSFGKVRWSKMFTWYLRGVPPTQSAAADDGSGMIAGLGFTDLPLRHACTMSFWPSAALVSKYAYGKSSAHSEIKRRSVDEGWFSESLFVRFAVLDHSGSWSGRDPLAVTAAATSDS